MAQYFQVVDQGQAGEELQASYSNIVDNSGVHYIIQTSEPNQTFVLDNVLEQPVLQQFPQQQQFLLVSSPPKPQQSLQPVVLNHTLQQPVMLSSAPPLRALNRANIPPRARSVLGVVARSASTLTPNLRPRLSTDNIRNQTALGGTAPGMNVPQGQPASAMNGNDMIKMEDGRILPLAEYQKVMEQRKLQRQKQEQLLHNHATRQAVQRAPRPPGPPRPTVRAPINSPRLATPRQVQPAPVLQAQQKQLVAKKQTARIIQPNQFAKMPKILRDFVPSQEIKDIINQNGSEEEFENSIRMFVLLAGGEQRLITFTTPKEDCTIQEILEQVGVAVDPDTKIGINEINQDGINIVVSVGYDDDEDEEAHKVRIPRLNKKVEAPAKAPSPVPEPPEEPPKLVPGKMAVCTHCGYLSEDFNRCQRCKRKLPDNIKSVLSQCVPGMNVRKPGIEINLKPRTTTTPSANATTSTSTVAATPPPPVKSMPARKKALRPRLPEPEPSVVTLSSDEEGDDNSNDNPALPIVDKEPSLESLKAATACPSLFSTSLACCTIACRTIRIGSYRFVPSQEVTVNAKELVLKIPNTKTKEAVTITIPRRMVFKVLASFQKALPVVFIYILPAEAEKISTALGMTPEGEFYYNPIAENQLHRRMVLLPSTFGEEDKWVFQTVFGNPNILEEVTAQEANSILLKTCTEDVTQALMLNNAQPSLGVRQLLIYPPGKGGISINTEDFMCLERDQFLNDVIIDFYLKYMVHQMEEKKRAKVQVFSTFFYTRLTTKPARPLRKVQPTEIDSNLTAAQKRHARVKNWTKNIDLFEKDFIIVPINENAHWFLAIICFPGMKDGETFEGVKVSREVCKTTAKKKANVSTIKPPTQVQGKTGKFPISEVEDNSDKDEAEGDESEFEVEDGEDATQLTAKSLDGVPIKQPCILIFDSLAGAGRSRVVATLRDYLTCEYAAKKKEALVFTKHNILGACPKIPQQNNYTDCGLYLLQYVEHFFKDPISDYRIPIKGLKTWFDEIIVTRKREDISNLIKELMIKHGKDVNLLPAIALPTQNGDLVPDTTSDKDEEDETAKENPEDESMDTDAQLSNCGSNSPGSESSSVTGDRTNTRRSAMSYLKAKRIIKVKADNTSESEEEPKKRKLQK